MEPRARGTGASLKGRGISAGTPARGGASHPSVPRPAHREFLCCLLLSHPLQGAPDLEDGAGAGLGPFPDPHGPGAEPPTSKPYLPSPTSHPGSSQCPLTYLSVVGGIDQEDVRPLGTDPG